MKNYFKSEKKYIADQPNCTYWWIIYLKPEFRTNPQVQTITGYSKFQNEAEAKDKIQCLCYKILMLNKHNYIDKSTHIEIYKKLSPLPNRTNDRLIITIKPTHYEIPSMLVGQMPSTLKTFLDNFYKAKTKNLPVENLVPLPIKKQSKDDLFIVSNHNFKSVLELYNFCEKQIANGEASELVQNFYRKYLPKLVQA